MDDAEFAHVYTCAQRSVTAWSEATQKHGSLLQSWIHGREVREDDRYPDPDIVDRRYGYQYFYHSHRHGALEHGHIHVFHHATASGKRRYINREKKSWLRTAPSHLFAISLDNRGLPIGLFTVNLWVTKGHWFDATTTLEMVRRLQVDIAGEHGESAVWLTGFVGMYAAVIEPLLRRRDKTLARLSDTRDMKSVLKDHRRDLLSIVEIDWLRDVQTLEAEQKRRSSLVRPK